MKGSNRLKLILWSIISWLLSIGGSTGGICEDYWSKNHYFIWYIGEDMRNYLNKVKYGCESQKLHGAINIVQYTRECVQICTMRVQLT